MTDEDEAVRRVIQAFEQSDWTEIDVRFGSVRVHLSTDPSMSHAPGGGSAAAAGVSAGATPAPAAAIDHRPTAEPTAEPVDVPVDVPNGAVHIMSPSPGIFWRAPEPGAPPFADVGDVVDAAQTLCIVEVMKLMNHVKAGAPGEVVAVFVENGVAVQAGEALFAVVPAPAPDAS